MKSILMSLVPGAIMASLVDFLYPHLTSVGFVYAFVGGMILYLLLSHILSSLIGNRHFRRFDEEASRFLHTRLY